MKNVLYSLLLTFLVAGMVQAQDTTKAMSHKAHKMTRKMDKTKEKADKKMEKEEKKVKAN